MSYKAKLDRIFSEYIRRRDSDENGFGRCISCGKIVHWKDADCGHYVNRKHLATRYDEQNCNLQCRSCNRFDEGNIQGYRRGLVAKIGIDAVDMLEIKKHNTCKISDSVYKILIAMYQKKIKELNGVMV